MIISLIGFMAAGKTSIGKQLAESVKAPFVDLDAYIEDKENKTISEIFADGGEAAFRKLEEKYLEDLLEEHIVENPETIEDKDAPTKKCTMVLSLGGGAVISPLCRDLIKHLTFCIYVKTDLNTIFNRLQSSSEKEKRPLLAESRALRDSLEALFYQREDYYIELADKTISGK